MSEKHVEPTYRPEWQQYLIMGAIIAAFMAAGMGVIALLVGYIDHIPAPIR